LWHIDFLRLRNILTYLLTYFEVARPARRLGFKSQANAPKCHGVLLRLHNVVQLWFCAMFSYNLTVTTECELIHGWSCLRSVLHACMCVGPTGPRGRTGSTGATGATGAAEPADPAANCSGPVGKLRCITFFIHCSFTSFALVFFYQNKEHRSQLVLHWHLRTPVPPVVLVFNR